MFFGSGAIIEQIETSAREISSKIAQTNQQIKELQPNDYEIELKRLNNEILKVKTINLELRQTIQEQEKTMNNCIEYIKKIENVKVEETIRTQTDPRTAEVIELEYITIPQFQIARIKNWR